ncbi:lamin-L(III)-like [Melanotaenia boesemani]|uniref:lamin-L(III)-like n=1 Tax=Melanotaenia boesemani TaxID=1250792 RepID=UPI001C051AA1|nr:lamin-L(III)-like [Melanotaenia boesemani]
MAWVTSTPAAAFGGRSSRRAAAGPSPSSPSPTRLSRVQEKQELQNLNDRLANYIQRVRELESERSFMLMQLEEKDDSKRREMGNVRRLYEEELADVRKSLDAEAGERARLQIDYGNLREEHEKLQTRNQKKEDDLTNALTQWRKAEANLNSKDAEHTALLSEKRKLCSELTDLQGQMENMESLLGETKNQLSSEILRRVDMENQAQTLKEQLDLQRNISEQEILQVRSRHESRLVEVESGRQREFESKLAEAMQQLREDHDSKLQQYKEELQRTFTSKLQNAQQAALEKNNVALATREELQTTKLRAETLSSQLQHYQKDKMMLESRLQELARTLDREREVWQQKLSQKEQELLNMTSQMSTQLEDYENLLDVKLALDLEINAYRKMLEVEEQRLKLSPSPPQQSSVSGTQERCSRKLRGKKRKHEEASGSSPAYKMSSCSAESGVINVAEISVEGKYIKLKNNSDSEQPLGGWVVQQKYSESGEISFHIPSSCILAAGQTITIWAAGSEGEVESGDLVLEDHRTWGPVSDVRVILLNSNREKVAERRDCTHGSGEERELDFEEVIAGSHIQRFQRQPTGKFCSVS